MYLVIIASLIALILQPPTHVSYEPHNKLLQSFQIQIPAQVWRQAGKRPFSRAIKGNELCQITRTVDA